MNGRKVKRAAITALVILIMSSLALIPAFAANYEGDTKVAANITTAPSASAEIPSTEGGSAPIITGQGAYVLAALSVVIIICTAAIMVIAFSSNKKE